MTRNEYLENALKLFQEDKITEEQYNTIIEQADAFVTEEEYDD